MTFVACPRSGRIVASCGFDGLINAACFLACVVQFLGPILQEGDIVVMDNLSSHKGAAGAKLFFLLPYSPDLNPIEQAFSQLKTLLRKENATAQAQAQVTDRIGKLLQKVTPTASANYLRTAGYAT